MDPVDVSNDNNKPSPSVKEGPPKAETKAKVVCAFWKWKGDCPFGSKCHHKEGHLKSKSPVSTGPSNKNRSPSGKDEKKVVKERSPSAGRAEIPSQDGRPEAVAKPKGKKSGMNQTANQPKDPFEEDETAKFSLKVNPDQRAVARIFASLGATVHVNQKPVLVNLHAISAGTRDLLMYRQSKLPAFVSSKQIVVLDPRDSECEFFRRFIVKGKQTVHGQRRGQFGHDMTANRPLLNEDPMQPQTCYICNDASYWYNPDAFFKYHRLADSPDFKKGGVNVLLSLMDFRGEGECVFVHRYQLPAQEEWEEDVLREELLLDAEGTPVPIPGTEDREPNRRNFVKHWKEFKVHHNAEKAVDVLEGVGYKRDGIVTWYSAVGAGGTDARYTHPWDADAFFEHTRYVFVTTDGTRVLMTCHVESVVGYRTLFAVNFSVAPDGVESEKEVAPRVGFVDNGVIPSLLNDLMPKSMSVLRTQDSAVRNFYRDCEGTYQRLMPSSQHIQLAFLGPVLYEARMRTYALSLHTQQSFLEPGGVVASVADVAKAYRQRELEKRMEVGPQISEPIVSLMGETTRLGFLLEGIRAVKVWGFALWERLSAWLKDVGRWIGQGGMPMVLDIAKLVQRALRAVPTVERKWNQVRESVLGFAWVKKSSESIVALLAKHPLLDNALHILTQFIPIFLKATIEECLKTLASPVFLVIAAIEIVADAIDIFYAESYEREEVVNFVRDSAIRIIAHGLLSLCPLPVAIVLHTGVNCVQTWREKRVFAKLREAVMEQALDDYMEDAQLEPLSFNKDEFEWVPESVLVKEGDGMVPVKQRPELLRAAMHQEFPTKKLVALDCEAARLMVRPQAGLLSMCRIVKERLESPIPKPNRENIRMGYDVATEYIFSKFQAVEAMSVAEFRTYIVNQEFNAAKTQWYMQRLDLLEKEGVNKVPVQPIVAKVDEVLPGRVLEGIDAAKERPIYPIDFDQLDLMRWLLVWKRNFSETFKVQRQGHLFTFTYMLDSRADLLDQWINEWSSVDGFHMLALGDDNIMMFVCHKRGWVGKNAKFAAYDLATCDKTCGLDVQLCFVDLMRKGGLSDREAKAHLERCKGLRELKIRGEPKDKRFYWESKEVSTVTGNPLTSIQAVFCQLLFVCMAWDQWVAGDAEDPEELGELLHAAGTLNGHVLEWEYDTAVFQLPEKRRFSNVTRRTYLGGLFVPDEEGLKWCPMAWLKTFFLFPDTEKIYGGDRHMEMHAAAISTDQGMLRTPIGSTLCATMRRLASAAGLTKMDFEEAAAKLHHSRSWYQKLKKTPLSLKPVKASFFFAALSDLCFSRGFDDPIPEWLDLEEELRTIGSLPATLGTSGIRCLYQPRFGVPKISHRTKLDVFAALQQIVRVTRLIIVKLDYQQMTTGKKASKGSAPPKQKKQRQGKASSNQQNALGGKGAMQSAPVAQGRTMKTKGPRMSTMRNGDCRVVHREYIQDITASSGSAPTPFAATALAVNPGQSGTFPWLSSVARNFESYRFKKLKFCYETEAPSSLGGSLVVSLDYDATDPAPGTKQQAMAYRNAVRSAPWEPCCHISAQEDLNKQKSYFVRPGAQPANTDIKTYDVANAFVCTQNVTTSAAVCGEMYVEYDVELLTPVYEVAAGVGTLINATGTGTSNASFGGTNPIAAGTIGISVVGNVLTFAGLTVGQEYQLVAVDNTAASMTASTLVNITTVTILQSGGSGVLIRTFTAQAPTGGLTIALSGSTSQIYLNVSQMPPGSVL